MPILTINRDLELFFLGRNGSAHMCGVSVLALQSIHAVHIEPITSRGIIGRCSIQIPVAQLEEFIAALRLEAAEIALPRSGSSPTPTQLMNLYGAWGDHPVIPRSDWQYEVSKGDTQSGYWDFVAAKLDETSSDESRTESGAGQSTGEDDQ